MHLLSPGRTPANRRVGAPPIRRGPLAGCTAPRPGLRILPLFPVGNYALLLCVPRALWRSRAQRYDIPRTCRVGASGRRTPARAHFGFMLRGGCVMLRRASILIVLFPGIAVAQNVKTLVITQTDRFSS